MATMANWNGHTFEVGADLIRSFEDLTIKGSCETEDKKKNKQGFVKRKNGQAKEITFNLPLSALLGVTNVRREALVYVKEAYNGATGYFYIGTKKLIKAKVMLTSAEISEVVTMPGRGEKWISCVVKMTFKQSSNDKGSTSTGSKKKKSVKGGSGKGGGGNGGVKAKIKGLAGTIAAGKKGAKDTINMGKVASKDKIKGAGTNAGGAFTRYAGIAKKAQTGKDTGQKKVASTGRVGAGVRLLMTK